eukprot:TRINITY_DN21157_c0_g1_i1.p1 TRINITY_DN21157_c0_g1~~TRINITY_DN21157_c0_g1_i1.p1  ORF type:complete len:601 (+),score=171.10 TRINITY_DN21157_c0_g1_i1:38-1840(+)
MAGRERPASTGMVKAAKVGPSLAKTGKKRRPKAAMNGGAHGEEGKGAKKGKKGKVAEKEGKDISKDAGTEVASRVAQALEGSEGSAAALRELLEELARFPGLRAKRRVGSAASAASEGTAVDADDFYDNVVKIYTTSQEPDYANPWQREGVESCTGSGVVLMVGSKQMILTAAHVVANQTFVQVQRSGVASPDKYIAQVYAVRHECDLAVLSVDDDEFWDGLSAAPIGALPAHRDVVLVAGFPVGGEELSVTQGVVSRIEGQEYAQSSRRLLAVTVDAAINSGNSGGPVFVESGALVGIAFQADDDSENIGHIVPPPVILHFLEGVERHGPAGYKGFPSAGLAWQELTNPYLRRRAGLDTKASGVLVTDVFYGNTCSEVVQRHDVITAVDGCAVARNGTVACKGFGRHARVDLDVIFTTFQCGEAIRLELVRDGAPIEVEVTAQPVNDLVPLAQYDRNPPYFIYCGLVFQPLSTDFIGALEDDDTTLDYIMECGNVTPDRRQVVVLGSTLTDKVNVGYNALSYAPITKVNGAPVVDLLDFVAKVEATLTEVVEFETASKEVIVVPGPRDAEAQAANKRILKRYKVPSDRCLEHTAITNGG